MTSKGLPSFGNIVECPFKTIKKNFKKKKKKKSKKKKKKKVPGTVAHEFGLHARSEQPTCQRQLPRSQNFAVESKDWAN